MVLYYLLRVMRDVPLNEEELECWVEQAKWRKYILIFVR